jgi:tRNA threonylcarbamoyladenosine biosynthesis protein TsaB
MLIFAIDTSGQSGGVALAEADEESFRLIESAPIAGGTFSAQLIPTLSALLNKHGFRVTDIGGFAAASGPGSFTGLRVGLSAIKGLAETLHKPIAVVSVLEALAALASREGKIAAALDAGRKEIFLGIYERLERTMSMKREELLGRQEFLAALAAEAVSLVVTCDATVAELAATSHCQVSVVVRPGSEMIARIGSGKLLAGETVSVEALDANYLRRSDAEIFFKGNH